MYQITKTFDRYATHHQLSGLPEGHKCGNSHGHTYAITIVLQSETVDPVGFICDFGELAPFKAYLDAVFDHHSLNDTLPGLNPSCENLARYFYDWALETWPEVVACIVCESPVTSGAYFDGSRYVPLPNMQALAHGDNS